jgi:hypothetical protein
VVSEMYIRPIISNSVRIYDANRCLYMAVSGDNAGHAPLLYREHHSLGPLM